jgi:hypothetical protein
LRFLGASLAFGLSTFFAADFFGGSFVASGLSSSLSLSVASFFSCCCAGILAFDFSGASSSESSSAIGFFAAGPIFHDAARRRNPSFSYLHLASFFFLHPHHGWDLLL